MLYNSLSLIDKMCNHPRSLDKIVTDSMLATSQRPTDGDVRFYVRIIREWVRLSVLWLSRVRMERVCWKSHSDALFSNDRGYVANRVYT